MTDLEQREAAHKFINKWMKRDGNEDEEGRSYWIDFLRTSSACLTSRTASRSRRR